MYKKRFSIVFGLTADPIHKGHEQAIINGVEYCCEQGFEINKFLLVPVFRPNLIADKKMPIASFEQRFEMCSLVAKRLSKQLSCDIQVSEIEKKLSESSGKTNYSYNTIKRMVGEIPAYAGMTGSFDGWLFMVSADHFQGRWPKFRKWYKWQELLKLSGLLINQRPGHKINGNFIKQLKAINQNIYRVETGNSIDISSSEIRANKGKYSSKYLSSEINQYMMRNNLY